MSGGPKRWSEMNIPRFSSMIRRRVSTKMIAATPRNMYSMARNRLVPVLIFGPRSARTAPITPRMVAMVRSVCTTRPLCRNDVTLLARSFRRARRSRLWTRLYADSRRLKKPTLYRTAYAMAVLRLLAACDEKAMDVRRA
jgi:hypothetical protein